MEDSVARASSLALSILVGALSARTGRLGKDAGKAISWVVFNLTLPAAIICAFQSTSIDPAQIGLVILGFLTSSLPLLLSALVYRSLPRGEKIVQLANVSGLNVGCFGLPFVQAFFSPAGVITACLFDVGNSLMCTGGTWALLRGTVLERGGSAAGRLLEAARTLLSSTPLVCYALLIALALLGMRPPAPLVRLIDPLAKANSFLSMFMLGIMIKPSVTGRGMVELARLLAWRLGAALVLFLVVRHALPLAPEPREVLSVLAWAPAASTGPLYTLWAGGDEGVASLANALTVLVGLVAMTALALTGGA